MELEHADWIVDPGLVDYDDMICILAYCLACFWDYCWVFSLHGFF